jgi:hypothetical protein
MSINLGKTCPLCGLRMTNRALLELHVREDHPQRAQPAPSGGATAPVNDSPDGPATDPRGTTSGAAPAVARMSARTLSTLRRLPARIKQRLSRSR